MRTAALIIAAALAWTACSTAVPAPPAGIETGRAFSLHIGASAQARDPALQVGFAGVTADSRCPKGERCVWAGDAVVHVWVQRAGGARQLHELHVAAGAAQAVRVQDRELRLLRLDPYPVSGKAIAASDYVATLTLGPASNHAPER